MGRGCPLPQPTKGSGERRKLPQRQKRVFVYLELEKTHLIATNMSFRHFCAASQKDILLPLRVGRNFQWVGRSTEWVGRGLPGLSLKPPLPGRHFLFICLVQARLL